jgi:hypothetical protein
MATPCRVSTECVNPDWPEELSEKVTTQHTSHSSKKPLTAFLGYSKNMTSAQNNQQNRFKI